jgi:hypothetical protein
MKLLKLVVLSILVVSMYSCSDDDSPEMEDVLTISDLAGSWKAISSVHTNNSDSSEKYDIVGNGGEIRYTMFNDGRVRTWIEFGDFSDEYDAKATLTGSRLTIQPVETTRRTKNFGVVYSGSTITLTDSNDSFDFSLTGSTPVSSTSVTVFVPNK